MCGDHGRGEPWRQCVALGCSLPLAILAALLSVLLAPSADPRVACASASRTTRGSRTAGHARGAARPARGARRRHRSVQPALGSDRGRARQAGLAGQRSRPDGLHERGIAAVVGLVGSPRWANGGERRRTSRRCGGIRGIRAHGCDALPLGPQWLVWNEPNQVRWLRPTAPAVYVRQLLNPAYAAIHRVNPGRQGCRRRHRSARPAPAVSRPLPGFAGCAGAPGRLRAPSVSRRRRARRRSAGGCDHCETISMATLERLLTEVGRAFGPKRIWLTEYGYQTGQYGVSAAAPGRADRGGCRRVHKAPAGRHADPVPREGRAGSGTLPEWAVRVSRAHRSALRSRFRSRSRRRAAAAASSSSGDRCARAAGRRPTASRFGSAARGLTRAARVRRGRAVSSASPIAAPKGASIRVFSPEDGTYSVADPRRLTVSAAPRRPRSRRRSRSESTPAA